MAGESAEAEYRRLRERRRRVDRKVLPWVLAIAVILGVGSYLAIEAHVPGIGFVGPVLVLGLVLPMLGPTQRETAWRRGAEGERIVGAALDRLTSDGFEVLHDRRMPRSRANIDHLVVGHHAIFTVDAKRYRGEIRVRGGRLIVNGRDRSKLVDQARRQRAAVAEALDRAGMTQMPVVPVLCFSGSEWPLLFKPRQVGDVLLCSPRDLRKRLRPPRDASEPVGRVEAVAQQFGNPFGVLHIRFAPGDRFDVLRIDHQEGEQAL
jgi:hypothetical protein